jgi:hypothetical protein
MNALLTALAPQGGVPGRNALATTYLDQVYASVHEEVKQLIRESEFLVLVIDGWSNIGTRVSRTAWSVLLVCVRYYGNL